MYKKYYEEWLNSDKLSEAEKQELISIKSDRREMEYRFGKRIGFGTAGMRGLIKLGTNAINVHMVKLATQGLSEYIKELGAKAIKRGVVISYDTRRKSHDFAVAAAIVLASNGIKVRLFSEVHPVPMLSFAVRQFKAVAGIMITASHNPKEYNGYKVYGEDGAQMSPEATKEVVKFIDEIGSPLSDSVLYDETKAKNIIMVPKSLDKKYYKTILALSLSKKEVKKYGKKIKIVYTPVHGSGYVPVTTILKKIGIVPEVVPEQIKQDTEFSTVEVPNPENKETLTLGIQMADFKNADVVLGTDPDCDRVGVAVRNNKGEFEALSGNQVGVLLLDYILRRLKDTGKLNKKGFVAKSFVSTSMAELIAEDYGVELMEVPVGFKFIGEKIKQLDDTGKREFIFGFEESCGYLRGTHCRDKDAVVTSMLFAEMVCYYSHLGVGVYQRLQELYAKYGYVYDKSECILYSGLHAMQDMNKVVDKLKKKKVEEIGGLKVKAVRDYSVAKRILSTGEEEDLDITPTNTMYFELDNGSFVCTRPSGTEPKLKLYYSIKGKTARGTQMQFKKIKVAFEALLK